METNPLTFKDMIRVNGFNKNLKSNNKNLIKISTIHLYKELPIRFSQRIRDLNKFSFGLNQNHNVLIIRDWYLTSFQQCLVIKQYFEKYY